MHGREGEERKRRRHMWPVPALGTTSVAVDSAAPSVDFFCKDGRKISVGDCALFKPPQESPPFIGIIRWLTSGREDNLKLGVNWLYRPAEVKVGKGILLEAAPNEVFYSFHKDEIPAASLLHPCKVAFLRKGVELPSGISSFVCRRVYDIANRCLWWLTDQDYINERQEEVDQLLDKTQLEMHAGVQSGGRSPKPLNGPTSTPQLKPGLENLQNSANHVPSQGKGKKRERGDQVSEHVKRERSLKLEDGDSNHFRMESLKSEISRITDKGGLLDAEGVEKLVQLMQPDRGDKKIDLVGRIMLADVLSTTDRLDCLGRFVQLRGLPILDEWLQEVHKGKTGDGSSPKDSDRTVDDFLLALLRALDKLPVNLHALQNSNIGRSVNNLRSHKNLEIQKKARSLVDTWKKRVHAEMKINDAKSGSSQTVSWPTKPGFSEISHGGSRRTGGSSEVAIKSAVTQPSATKIGTVKVGHVEALSKFTPVSPGSVKLGSLSGSVGINSKDPHSKTAIGGAPLDIPVTIKEEKSSSSSQSQNNSQSYSSDHAKNVGSSWKEDARSSTAGSMNKVSGGSSRHRKSSNGYVGLSVTGVKKEISSAKCSSSNRNLVPEKVSQSGLTCERTPDMPPMDHGNSHRLIVRFPNPGRSPARSASGSSFEEPSMVNRGSSPGHSEKHDNDRKEEGKSDVCQTNVASDVNMESWQSNDVKVGVPVSDEGDGSPVTVFDKEHCKTGEENLKLVEASNVTSSWGHDPKSVKSYETPFSSINALIESCIKYSEAGASTTVGDDTGIGLLASVAAGEMSKSIMVSPASSPGRNSPEDTCTGNDAKMISPCEEDVLNECQQDVGTNDTEMQSKQGNTVVPQCNKELLHHLNIQVLTNASGECKSTSSIVEEKGGENSDHAHSSCMNLQQIGDSCLKVDGGSDEIVTSASVVSSSAEIQEEGTAGEGASQMYEQRKLSGAVVNGGGVSELKHKARSALFDENKNFDSLDDRNANSSQAVATSIVHGSVNEACDSSNVVSSVKLQEEALEESQLCSLSEMDCDHKNSMHEVHSGGIVTEQKPSAPLNCLDSVEGSNEDAVLSGSTDMLDTENNDKLKAETVNDIGVQGDVDQDEKHLEWDGNDPPTDDGQVGAGLHPTLSDHSGEGLEEKSGGKEVIESHCGRSAPQEESPAKPVQESEQCVNSSELKLTALNANETPECVSIGNASSISVVGDDMAAKLDFDLNEGFPVDDANQGEPANSAAPGCSSAIHLPSPLPFAVSSMSSGLPASITVAAAAKGSFVLPENLVRNKVELGWKGSAATSAFRPAEPRKVLETLLSTAETFHITAGKQGRPPLDIDLNVPDERVVEDTGSQSSGQRKVSDSGPVICGLARGEMFGCSPASIRSAGGLDFDLNRIDEGSDIGQIPSCTSQRLEFPLLPIKSSPAGFSNGEVSVLRNIDLNNGPALDEMSTESAPRNHHSKNSMSFLSPVAGLRMANTELGNISSWFPPGNSYSAVTIPSILPDRGEQPYPFVAPSGSQRIIGTPTGGINFGPDVYRGSVLSSSPSGAFTPATPFQCPGFPFGPNFSLPSTSFSSVSSYMDSSSGAALCFPTVPSPLVAPSGAVSPHFPRPYVISLSDSTSNGGAECNRKWGRQGLDLNAGPGGMDFEGRDERFSLRQLSVSSSQALAEQARMYQAAGGVPKRKEPEGGWDAERFSYKQSSWP